MRATATKTYNISDLAQHKTTNSRKISLKLKVILMQLYAYIKVISWVICKVDRLFKLITIARLIKGLTTQFNER